MVLMFLKIDGAALKGLTEPLMEYNGLHRAARERAHAETMLPRSESMAYHCLFARYGKTCRMRSARLESYILNSMGEILRRVSSFAAREPGYHVISTLGKTRMSGCSRLGGELESAINSTTTCTMY